MALEAYLADQHLKPSLRSGVGCPSDWVNVIVGERFGALPWDVEQGPADRVLYYMRLLGIEGEMSTWLADTPADAPLTIHRDEDGEMIEIESG